MATIYEDGIIGKNLTDEQAKRVYERLILWSDDLGISWIHKDFDACYAIHLKILVYCESMLDMGLITVTECERMKKYWSMTRPEKIRKEYRIDE